MLALLFIMATIAIHEYGHYLRARRCGVVPTHFSVGIGLPLFEWKQNGTKFTIAALPFGGYVSFPVSREEMSARSVWLGRLSRRLDHAMFWLFFFLPLTLALIIDAGIWLVARLVMRYKQPLPSAYRKLRHEFIHMAGAAIFSRHQLNRSVEKDQFKDATAKYEETLESKGWAAELTVALAGPAVNIVVGLVLFFLGALLTSHGDWGAAWTNFCGFIGELAEHVGDFVNKVIFHLDTTPLRGGSPDIIHLSESLRGGGSVAAVILAVAKLNLVLGVLNLVPFPLLDGGHSVIAIMRRFLSPDVYHGVKSIALTFAGLFLVTILGIIVYQTLLLPAVHAIF